MPPTEEHVMNVRLLLALLFISASGIAVAQTAREYFNELRDSNAFTHYADEYVCFLDKDQGGFAVIAKTKDIEKMMAANRKAGTKPEPPLDENLVVKTYFKGVASDTTLYERIDKDSDERWSLEYKSPFHGKTVYSINWVTGRYRLLVYALDRSKTVPAAENFGKCELIHPWAPPPSK
jgi:hypothetical protein